MVMIRSILRMECGDISMRVKRRKNMRSKKLRDSMNSWTSGKRKRKSHRFWSVSLMKKKSGKQRDTRKKEKLQKLKSRRKWSS